MVSTAWINVCGLYEHDAFHTKSGNYETED